MFRNNLILGLPGEQGYWLRTQADRLDMDYTGYNVAAAERSFAKLNNVRYEDMAALIEGVGIERHSVRVGGDAFLRASPPPGQQVTVDVATLDLRLREGSAAIDAGAVLPGLNDGFHGESPDLGCYERGRPRPHYGPADEGNE